VKDRKDLLRKHFRLQIRLLAEVSYCEELFPKPSSPDEMPKHHRIWCRRMRPALKIMDEMTEEDNKRGQDPGSAAYDRRQIKYLTQMSEVMEETIIPLFKREKEKADKRRRKESERQAQTL
jgi:hypothetical protein